MSRVKYPLAPGTRFGRLVVLSADEGPRSAYVCRCDCGTEGVFLSGHLRSGATRSCGCYNREMSVVRSTKHGLAKGNKTAGYKAWRMMNRRCSDPGSSQYSYYGGRGIKVCERWKDPVKFVEDMGEPIPGMSLDRIDNSGNYEPGNVRWATAKQQSRNRRSNRMLTFNGETRCAAEWAEVVGIPSGAILRRLNKGLTAEEALTRSLRIRRRSGFSLSPAQPDMSLYYTKPEVDERLQRQFKQGQSK